MAYFCTLIVGAVFLITGMVKALSSRQFIWHVFRYGLLPPRIVPLMAISFIGLECALGVALILHEFPQWLVPGSIVLLLGLSALTLWSTSSGRTSDCGCYQGLLAITPKQSLLLNVGYILLLGIAWLYPVADHHTKTWQWVLTSVVLVSVSLLSWQSRYQPLVDFNHLTPGRQWKPSWLKNSSFDLQQGSHFVVFLSKGCPTCKRWIPFLNVMNTQKDFPQVIGIMDLTNEELEVFRDELEVYFPLVVMDKPLFNSMVDAFPTAVLIEDGFISSKWIGEIPEEFLDRIVQLYEKAASPHQEHQSGETSVLSQNRL